MKIIVATPILYDEKSPFNHLFYDILRGLLDAGHEVIRIVAVENLEDTDYKMGLNQISYIPVIRKRTEKSNIIGRYIQDSFTNIRMALLLRKLSADVLLEDVSYSSFWSVKIAKSKNMKIVSMLQDIWPDNAVESGLISRKSLLYRYFETWQKSVYKNSDRIICISQDMKTFITQKGVSKDKIEVIYNWGYSDNRVMIPWEENKFAKMEHLSPNIFYPVYAGNIGKMQNVEVIVEAARELQTYKDIEFLIIGDGAKKEEIEEKCFGLTNVKVLPFQPSNLAVHIYSAAGINLIPLVKGGIHTALPSKTGVVLSCGKPTAFAFGKDTQFAHMIYESGAGYCVDSNDGHALAEIILNQYQCPCKNSENVYKFFETHFVPRKNIGRYVKIIEAES